MKKTVHFLKALGQHNRLRLVKALLGGEYCVCELTDALELSQSNLSRHLSLLDRAGLLVAHKKATWAYYSILPESASKLRNLLGLLGDPDSPRAQADAERLHKRVAMRHNGECCISDRQLPKSGVR